MTGIDRFEIGLELRNVGAVVRRIERSPKLLHDLAAVVLEHALEAGDVFMPEGEVVGDHGDALVLEFFGGVIGQRVTRLCRGGARPHEPRIWLALRHVFRAGDGEDRRARGADIVVDGQSLKGGQRTDQDCDVEPLDEFLCLGTSLCRIAGGIGCGELDRSTGERVVALLEKHGEALLHLQPARGERTGLDGQKPDAQRRRLRWRGRNLEHRYASGQRSLDHGAAIDGHGVFSLWDVGVHPLWFCDQLECHLYNIGTGLVPPLTRYRSARRD